MKAHGPKSMVSPESAVLSVFITPWMKPTCIQRAMAVLAFHGGLKQRQAGPRGVAGIGKVAIYDVVGKTFDGFQVATRGEILEG